jgi:hypothetical protein
MSRKRFLHTQCLTTDCEAGFNAEATVLGALIRE